MTLRKAHDVMMTLLMTVRLPGRRLGKPQASKARQAKLFGRRGRKMNDESNFKSPCGIDDRLIDEKTGNVTEDCKVS